MPRRSSRDAMLATFREESIDLLVARVRGGVGLVLVAIMLFGAIELWLRRPTLPSLLAVKGVQIGTVVAVMVALRRRPTWGGCVLLGLASMFTLCVTLGVSGVLTNEVASTPLLLILVTLVTGAFLPWGVWPQAATGIFATVVMVLNALLVQNVPPQFGYSAVAAILTFVASTYVARELDRQRLEQRIAEEDLRGSTRELRHEMQVTGAISRVSREVIAALGAPALLDRLCQLTAEALGCDASFTFLRAPGDPAFVVVAGYGERPERLARLRRQSVPEIALGELLHRFERGEVVQVVAASVADVLPIDAATTLCVALRRGDEVVGILAALYRDAGRVVGEEQRRVLAGVARVGSMALAHAGLLDALAHAARAESAFRSTFTRDLRGRVGALVDLADVADGSAPDPERRQAIARLRQASHQLLVLVDETMALARTEADELRPERVALSSFWTELGTGCARLPRTPDVVLQWTPAPAAPTIVTDAHKLAAIVRTLVADALARTSAGHVSAELVDGGNDVLARVADTGVLPGGDASDEIDGGEGDPTWLALHIVRRLTEQLGGSVALERGEENGSIVTVRIPVARRSSPLGCAA